MNVRQLSIPLLLAGSLGLVACGSSSSAKGTATTAPTSAAAAPAASAASSTGAPASSGSSAIAQAEAAEKAAATFPTTIPVTDPLPSAPPKGKTVVYLQCEQEECAHEGDGIKAAAAAIGWTEKTLNFQAANPATLVAALKTALQYKPVGVYFSGVPQAAWSSEQADYAKAGAYIVENFDATAPTGAGTLPGRGYGDDSTHIGTLLADEQITDAQGQPANSLLVSVPSYPVFVPTATAYKAEITSACPGCKVTDVDATLPDLLSGKLISEVVSAAKRASNLKYIVSVDGAFTATLPSALKTAGITGVQLISGQGEAADQKNVVDGTQLATINAPFVMGGYQDVDMAIRTVMGLPVPQGDHVTPIALLTKDNVGTPQDSYDIPSDFASQFKALWKVG